MSLHRNFKGFLLVCQIFIIILLQFAKEVIEILIIILLQFAKEVIEIIYEYYVPLSELSMVC
jgi:hypothetical protein